MDLISDFRKAKKKAASSTDARKRRTADERPAVPTVDTKGIDSLFARKVPGSGGAAVEAVAESSRSSSSCDGRSSSSSSSSSLVLSDEEGSQVLLGGASTGVDVMVKGGRDGMREEVTIARVGICDKWIYQCTAVDGELGCVAFPLRGGGLKVYTDQLDVVLPGQPFPGEVHEVLALEGRGVVIASVANVVYVWNLAHAKDSTGLAEPIVVEISQTSTVVKLAQVGRTGMCLVGTSTGNVKVVDASDAGRPYLTTLVLDNASGGAGMVTVLASNKEGSIWMIGNEKSPVRFYSPSSRGWLTDQKAGINAALHGASCIAACEFQPNAWLTVWVNPENDLWMEMPNGTSIDFPREAETVFDIMFRRDGIISVATSLGEFHFDAATGILKIARSTDSEAANRTSSEPYEVVAAQFDRASEKLITLMEAKTGQLEVFGFVRELSMRPWRSTSRSVVCELPKGVATEKVLKKLCKDAATEIRTWDLGRWEGVILCGGQHGLRCYIYSARQVSILFTLPSDKPITALCSDLSVGTIYAGYYDGSVLSLATKSKVYDSDELIHALQAIGNYLIITTDSGRRVQVDQRLLIANAAPKVDLATVDGLVAQFPGITVRRFGLVESQKWTVLACEGGDIVAARIVEHAGTGFGRCLVVANEEGVVELIRCEDGVVVGRGIPDEDPIFVWVTTGGRILRFYSQMSRVSISIFTIDEARDDEAEVVLAQRAYHSRLEVLESTMEVTSRLQEQIRQGAVIEASQRAASRAVATASSTFGHIRDKLMGAKAASENGVSMRVSMEDSTSVGSTAKDTKDILGRARAQIANNQEKLAGIQAKSAEMSEQSEEMLRLARGVNKKQHKKWIFF